MTELTATTELDAVNIMLGTIKESPVTTLEDNESVDAATALSVLREISKMIQSRVWHFNTDTEVTLTRNGDGEVTLPSNCVRVDYAKGHEQYNVDPVQRGTRLYDRKNQTYVFDADPVVDMTVLLSFDELPEPARYYITIKAARVFQRRTLGSETLDSFVEDDELRALVAMMDFDGDTADLNILSGDWSVFRVLNRPSA